MNVFFKNLAKPAQTVYPRKQVRMRQDEPFAWHDEGSERVDPKTGWKWYDTQPAANSSSPGWLSVWWQSSSWSQASKWFERYFLNQGVSLAGNADSLNAMGGANTQTQPTHASHARTPEFFSRGSRLESSSQVSYVSYKNNHSSHLAQHVARAFVVVSFTIEHCFIFHSLSNPTLFSSIYQTFIDAIFTRRLSLRRSIEFCLSVFLLKERRLKKAGGFRGRFASICTGWDDRRSRSSIYDCHQGSTVSAKSENVLARIHS